MADWTLRLANLELFSRPIAVRPELFPSCRAGAKEKPAVCCMPVTQCLGIHVMEQTNIFLSNTSAWSRLVIALSWPYLFVLQHVLKGSLFTKRNSIIIIIINIIIIIIIIINIIIIFIISIKSSG